MASSLFQMLEGRNSRPAQTRQNNSMVQKIQAVNDLMAVLKNDNPDALFNKMMQENQNFAEFINKNKGRSLEEIAALYNLDISFFNQLYNKIRR